MFEVFGGLAILTSLMLISGLKVVREYDRLVVMRFGKYVGERGPGLQLVVPFIERSQKVDIRVITMPIPQQESMTRDNVPVKTAAVCFFQIVDARSSVTRVEDPIEATGQLAQAALRGIIGEYELDEILNNRDQLNARLQALVDAQTAPWGIKINSLEIKDVEVPDHMKRAMARQAEAERLRRAKVTAAEGEAQSAEKLAQAADVMFDQPGTFRLRQLQSMVELAAGKDATLLIPIPFQLTGNDTEEESQ